MHKTKLINEKYINTNDPWWKSSNKGIGFWSLLSKEFDMWSTIFTSVPLGPCVSYDFLNLHTIAAALPLSFAMALEWWRARSFFVVAKKRESFNFWSVSVSIVGSAILQRGACYWAYTTFIWFSLSLFLVFFVVGFRDKLRNHSFVVGEDVYWLMINLALEFVGCPIIRWDWNCHGLFGGGS